MYADYSFYTETFYGTAISEADFPRLSSRASDFIDYYTRGKAAKVTDENVLPTLAKCCCAIAEAMQTDEQNKALVAKATAAALASANGEIKSETVGSWSQSYATASDYIKAGSKADAVKDARAAYAAIAQEYLVNTGLLYRGGCLCG